MGLERFLTTATTMNWWPPGATWPTACCPLPTKTLTASMPEPGELTDETATCSSRSKTVSRAWPRSWKPCTCAQPWAKPCAWRPRSTTTWTPPPPGRRSKLTGRGGALGLHRPAGDRFAQNPAGAVPAVHQRKAAHLPGLHRAAVWQAGRPRNVTDALGEHTTLQYDAADGHPVTGSPARSKPGGCWCSRRRCSRSWISRSSKKSAPAWGSPEVSLP